MLPFELPPGTPSPDALADVAEAVDDGDSIDEDVARDEEAATVTLDVDEEEPEEDEAAAAAAAAATAAARRSSLASAAEVI